jgi:hypothetical protein
MVALQSLIGHQGQHERTFQFVMNCKQIEQMVQRVKLDNWKDIAVTHLSGSSLIQYTSEIGSLTHSMPKQTNGHSSIRKGSQTSSDHAQLKRSWRSMLWKYISMLCVSKPLIGHDFRTRLQLVEIF